MNIRPLAALAIALSCAFAAPATAGGTVILDGVRRTNAVVRGEVNEPAFVATERLVEPFDPTLKECGSSSCDITVVTARLPRGSTSGRFRVTVTMPRSLNGYIALYNREGERIAQADILESQTCCNPEDMYPDWRATFVVPRLAAGTYQLVVFDRGGRGQFTADLELRANPPDRQPPGKS